MGWIAGFGALLLLPGFILDEPLRAYFGNRVEPPVSWSWHRWKLGPEVRIPLLLVPIIVIPIIAQSLWVFAIASSAFLAPLALRRRSLSPRLLYQSFFLGLGVAAYGAGFAVGGPVGVLCVAVLAFAVIFVLFLAVPKL